MITHQQTLHHREKVCRNFLKPNIATATLPVLRSSPLRSPATISSATIGHYTYPFHHIPKCSVVIVVVVVVVAVFANVVAVVVFGAGPVMVVIIVIVVVVALFVNVVAVVVFRAGTPPNGFLSPYQNPNGEYERSGV